MFVKLARNGTRFFKFLVDELFVYDKINDVWTLTHKQTIPHTVDGIFTNAAGDRIFIARFLNLYVYTFDGFTFNLEQTINSENEVTEITGKGRHDPCVVPRAVPIVEAMTALVLADFWLLNKARAI